jgi:NAD+ kinase
MKPAYRRIGVTVKSDLSGKDAVVRRVLALLKKSGAQVCVDSERLTGVADITGLKKFTCTDDIDLLVVLGGDGTILRSVRELKNFSVPILSINRGNIGFLAEMNVDEATKLLSQFLAGKGVLEERSVLRVAASRGQKILYDGFVLNEAVISQGSIARLIDVKTKVNDEILTVFRSDGLIMSTPTGSTAYTLAAGGPIVHPELSAMILTPINSHTFSQKPIVLPGSHVIEAEIMPRSKKFGDVEISLTLDGQTYLKLKPGDTITATIHDDTVKFVRRKKETFYSTLRTKLKWGERPEE